MIASFLSDHKAGGRRMDAVAVVRRRRGTLVALCAVAVAVGSAGCGSRRPAPIRVEPPSAVAQIRAVLESYAKTGELDSGLVGVREQIDALRQSDAAKADALAADFPKLEAAKGAESVKKVAKEMLEKIP